MVAPSGTEVIVSWPSTTGAGPVTGSAFPFLTGRVECREETGEDVSSTSTCGAGATACSLGASIFGRISGFSAGGAGGTSVRLLKEIAAATTTNTAATIPAIIFHWPALLTGL